ncbi:TPA_asm: N [Gymnadenia densiflora virus 1]|uniref:Nucleoprotein n=1 Tax=Gymnadenia densiflora virus 1 TaxID=3070916 RepID=A0A8D9PGT5_9RHAB|nr:N [Gymnadenia densiflora virus 1] [Gymnadenia densiflora virus 1]DAF42328.1 TPA_asm: N [Gymnadenia densiflora virus 1]
MSHRVVDVAALVTYDEFVTGDDNVGLQTEPPKDWDDIYFGMIPIWGDLPLPDDQILTVGGEFIQELTLGNITIKTAIKGLRLSLSLKSMNPSNTRNLIIPPIRPAQATATMLANDPLPELDSFSNQSFYILAQQAVGEQQQTALMLPGSNPAPNQDNTQVVLPEADSNKALMTSYAFLATYLMKLLVKNPSNVFLGITNMKEKYNSFYGPSRLINLFSCTLVQLIAYRGALLSQSQIGTSYTVAVAQTHQIQYLTLNQQEQGVLSYLCFLPFAYTGMHAYTMMISLRSFSNMPLGKLLTLFYSDMTVLALRKIADIVKNHERTVSNPNRSVLFRYCAPWAPNYFFDVRSKNCPHLIFTIATVWNKLKDPTEASDPLKIASIDQVSASMRKSLEKAGAIIANTLKKNMLAGIGASPAFIMALEEEEAEEAPGINWGGVAGIPEQI